MSATTSHPVADAIRERARILETQRANVARMEELKTLIDTELQGEKREFSDMAWLAGFDAATAHHAGALAREKAEGGPITDDASVAQLVKSGWADATHAEAWSVNGVQARSRVLIAPSVP